MQCEGDNNFDEYASIIGNPEVVDRESAYLDYATRMRYLRLFEHLHTAARMSGIMMEADKREYPRELSWQQMLGGIDTTELAPSRRK
jgi:hypothetical protein